MSEQEREQRNSDDERFQTDEVEAHRRSSSMSEEPTASDEESSEDFEAHKKR